MSPAHRTWTEHQVEQCIGNLLRGGVLIAAVVVLLGGILYLVRQGGRIALLWEFSG